MSPQNNDLNGAGEGLPLDAIHVRLTEDDPGAEVWVWSRAADSSGPGEATVPEQSCRDNTSFTEFEVVHVRLTEDDPGAEVWMWTPPAPVVPDESKEKQSPGRPDASTQ
jgi:hypothetical protein